MPTIIAKPLLLDETGKDTSNIIKKIGSAIADNIDKREVYETVIYGFYINSIESNPYNAVTYLEDAASMTPARMNYLTNKFDYGSWKDAFFMPRPCMLKYDGTVDYYLDENDYEKKENGEVSALGDNTLEYGLKYPGNAMMEWGKYNHQIWTKIVPDSNNPNSGSVYIANKQIDEDYTAYSFINNQGRLVNHFYTAIYNGSISVYRYNGGEYYRLRSIPRRIVMNSPGDNTSYIIPWDGNYTGTPYLNGFSSTTIINDINLCLNNNPKLDKHRNASLTLAEDRPNIGWFTEVFCDIQLINNLLILIGKSLDTQSVFGNGNIDGYYMDRYQNHGILYTGSHEYDDQMLPVYNVLNKSGLFWGTTGSSGINTAKAVKVFGMENWWGNQERRYLGHINKSNGITQNHFIKQTFGTEDGSSTIGYNLDGTDYIDSGVTVPTTSIGYIKYMKFINNNKTNVFLPETTGGSSSTYWSDNCYYDRGTYYTLHGGNSTCDFFCGAFFVYLNGSTSYATWTVGTTLSYKPFI